MSKANILGWKCLGNLQGDFHQIKSKCCTLYLSLHYLKSNKEFLLSINQKMKNSIVITNSIDNVMWNFSLNIDNRVHEFCQPNWLFISYSSLTSIRTQ